MMMTAQEKMYLLFLFLAYSALFVVMFGFMFKMLQKTRQLARDIALLADEEGKQDLPVADAPSVAPHVRSREL
ncbi:hypothetical protein CO251_07640 [Sulfobacillus sp. hq2]|uniref:CcmD family protein n=2 Tax=Sulfobacillus TaxID=28033 RepID=A0ABN5H405_9FIRM|nr:hypothetical protein BXT84_05380 [Sulfobacillus thermotolerans]POB10688.1 hypothetical protein CO251_07640 [Sulfobacillus sp. hq2]